MIKIFVSKFLCGLLFLGCVAQPLDDLPQKKIKKIEKATIQYTTVDVNLRKKPKITSDIITTIPFNTKVKTWKKNKHWCIVRYNDTYGFIKKKYLTKEKYEYGYKKLNPVDGVGYIPEGKETYYNLPMGGVCQIMRDAGYEGSYWIRSDGCKMYGEYIMVACDLNIYPRGSIVNTSLGKGIVCDTGEFINMNVGVIYDIGTIW